MKNWSIAALEIERKTGCRKQGEEKGSRTGTGEARTYFKKRLRWI